MARRDIKGVVDFAYLEAFAAGAKFIVGQFVGPGRGALNDVGDAVLEVEKEP